MNQLTAVLLGGPCDLTRMVIPTDLRFLRMPTVHCDTVTYGAAHTTKPTYRVQRYERTTRLQFGNARVYEWVGEEPA